MKPNKHHGKKAREYHEKTFNPWEFWATHAKEPPKKKLIIRRPSYKFADWA